MNCVVLLSLFLTSVTADPEFEGGDIFGPDGLLGMIPPTWADIASIISVPDSFVDGGCTNKIDTQQLTKMCIDMNNMCNHVFPVVDPPPPTDPVSAYSSILKHSIQDEATRPLFGNIYQARGPCNFKTFRVTGIADPIAMENLCAEECNNNPFHCSVFSLIQEGAGRVGESPYKCHIYDQWECGNVPRLEPYDSDRLEDSSHTTVFTKWKDRGASTWQQLTGKKIKANRDCQRHYNHLIFDEAATEADALTACQDFCDNQDTWKANWDAKIYDDKGGSRYQNEEEDAWACNSFNFAPGLIDAESRYKTRSQCWVYGHPVTECGELTTNEPDEEQWRTYTYKRVLI